MRPRKSRWDLSIARTVVVVPVRSCSASMAVTSPSKIGSPPGKASENTFTFTGAAILIFASVTTVRSVSRKVAENMSGKFASLSTNADIIDETTGSGSGPPMMILN